MLIPLRDDNPVTITPVVTYTVMGLCVLLYLLTLDQHAHVAATLGFGYVPARSFHEVMMPAGLSAAPWPLTLLSYQFLHGGFMHLAGNMLYLWIFANNVEEAFGHTRFLAFYLASGVLAALAHALTDTASLSPLVGASGAISGVLGAYLLLHPHARVLCVFSFFVFLSIRVPAYVVIGLWFGWQLLMLLAGGSGNVAWMAHIGGLIAGLGLTLALHRPSTPVRAARPADTHHIESAGGGGYSVGGRWFPRLAEAEAYRRALDDRAPVQMHRQRSEQTAENRIVHNADGSYTYRGRHYASLDEAARALLDESAR